MKISRKVSVVAATFLVAAATGQYMQSASHRAMPAPQPVPPAQSHAAPAEAAPQAAAPTQAAAVEMPTEITPVSAQTGDDALRAAMPRLTSLPAALPAVLTAPAAAEGAAAGAPEAAAAACTPRAEISVDQGAMLDFQLDAACHANQRVVIRHGGLAFTETTDAKGHLQVSIPAMEEAAKVTAMFPDDQSVSASTSVPELSLYDRVAVQWVGKDSFQLHALEFGAEFGGPGDVWAGNPGTPTPKVTAIEGFLTVLGDAKVMLPMVAQVYTYPTRLSTEGGAVKLVIDADVTAATCGREMLAETLRTQRDAAPKSTDLSVAMPDCGDPGGYVQLAGLLPDIMVAGD